MSQYRMTIFVEVDDVSLSAHDGDREPPPNDVLDWWGGDLEAALVLGIATIEHEQLDTEEWS